MSTTPPLIVPTNNPLDAILRVAKDLNAQEVMLGASNKYTAEAQMDQVSLYWVNLCAGPVSPLTVRIVSRVCDLSFDLGGGNRIPKISERKARTVAELRAAGVGVDRVLLICDGTPASHDLFQAALTMLDPEVALTLAWAGSADEPHNVIEELMERDRHLAGQLKREVSATVIEGELGPGIASLAQDGQFDLILLPLTECQPWPAWVDYVLSNATCRILLAPPERVPAVMDVEA
jgi:hypothetical protein